MNIMYIAWKEMKHAVRDKQTFIFIVAFPIILMLVLGSALSGVFNETITLDDIEVLYTNEYEEIVEPFTEFAKEMESSGIHFKQAESGISGKGLVEQGKIAGYVEIEKSGFKLHVNDVNTLESNILQGTLAAFVDQYNMVVEIAKVMPEKVEAAMTTPMKHDYIQDQSIDPNKQPGSMDYYAIVMTTMIVLYVAMGAVNLIANERTRHTAARLIVAPVRKYEIFIGKTAGSIVIHGLCITFVVLFSIFVYDANWGQHPGSVILLLLTEVIFAVSFGLCVGALLQSADMVIMVVIQLASFLGGAYFPIQGQEGIFKFITDLSPLTWENKALFNMIYADDLSFMLPAVLMNIGFTILFLTISAIILGRKEGL